MLGEIAALRAEGASIAIDDFGSGYSNLAADAGDAARPGQARPVADRRHRHRASRRAIVVKAVIQLINGLGAEVVAEAVENVAQADVLRAIGCDTVQGFVFAHPMGEGDYLGWLRNAERGKRSVA